MLRFRWGISYSYSMGSHTDSMQTHSKQAKWGQLLHVPSQTLPVSCHATALADRALARIVHTDPSARLQSYFSVHSIHFLSWTIGCGCAVNQLARNLTWLQRDLISNWLHLNKLEKIHIFFRLHRCRDYRVIRLGFACAGWWFVAVLFWVNDRVFCDVWTSISFPYLHCAWHILIFIASYTGCVLGSYFYAANEFPQLRPTVSYWPCWSQNLGLPYIVLKAMPREKPYETTEPVNYIPEKKCWAWSRQELVLFCFIFLFFCLRSNVCLIFFSKESLLF